MHAFLIGAAELGAGAPADPPWYDFVIGLSGLLFAVSTILVGIAGRRAGHLASAAIVAGVSFPLVFALGDTCGHIAWLGTAHTVAS